jgi:hypothetical protein
MTHGEVVGISFAVVLMYSPFWVLAMVIAKLGFTLFTQVILV